MDRIPLEPGRAVLSKAGRDAGKRFVVLAVDETFAYITDGDLRKVESPKKKKHKHLRAQPERFEQIAQLLQEGKTPTNADIRKCIAESDRP